MPKKVKPHKDEAVNKLLKLRDEAIKAYPDQKEEIGKMCIGLYGCAREKNKECLKGIEAKLTQKIKGGGKYRRSRSKSTGKRKKSRSRSKKR
jgi:hypothetical protein